MKTEHMVHMANQIAAFFAAYPEDEAVAGVADHLKKFWEPRMRKQLFEYVAAGGAGLHTLVLAAVKQLEASELGVPTAAKP
jgi:formate dehydrogenase subunit delta